MTMIERTAYDKYLEEAKKRIKPEDIPEDETGELYYNMSCLRLDCLNHDGYATDKIEPIGSYEKRELQTAAECEVILLILLDREKSLLA